MEPTAIATMLHTGHATVAEVARHFDTDHQTIRRIMVEHDIKPPGLLDPQFGHIRKLMQVQRPDPPGFEGLIYDDPEHNVINGIDCTATTPRVQAIDILQRYHGELRCWFTDRPTGLVMALDGNPNNFLVTNLIPVTDEIVTERFKDTPPLHTTHHLQYPGISLTLHFHQRYDRGYAGVTNPLFIETAADQWVRPYCEDIGAALAPWPPTPEHIVLWFWRHLSTALFKGIERIECRLGEQGASIDAQRYLAIVYNVLKRRVGGRLVATPRQPATSPIITP